MKKIDKIISLLEVISDYKNGRDYKLSMEFIKERDFTSLQELIKSIMVMESKNKGKKTIDFPKLIEYKSLIDEYVEQIEYIINNDR